MTAERRDQVLITVFLPDSFSASTFLSRWSSTNGPFLRLRGMLFYLPAQRLFLPVRRRRTIIASDALRRRARPSGLPFGLTGRRPPDVLPSPPPCGWSTGFMTTPRTVGRLPRQRLRPAMPQLMLACSELPTSPIVARLRTATLRISPEGRRSWAYGPSLRRAAPSRPR